jgi:hypothetical protein
MRILIERVMYYEAIAALARWRISTQVDEATPL